MTITTVSDHAVKRFRERTNLVRSDQSIRNRLMDMVNKGIEVKPKKYYGVVALINHGFRAARYFSYNNFIIVVEDEAIVTVHQGEANRWEKKGD
jgi:hypothetical protein